jgi:hypothetical protein
MKTHNSPGPWHTQGCTIYAGKNRVAQTWDTWYDGLPTPTMEADAGLIAAAPELLEALENLRGSIRHGATCRAPQAFPCSCDADQLWEMSGAAIAKARGGAR